MYFGEHLHIQKYCLENNKKIVCTYSMQTQYFSFLVSWICTWRIWGQEWLPTFYVFITFNTVKYVIAYWPLISLTQIFILYSVIYLGEDWDIAINKQPAELLFTVISHIRWIDFIIIHQNVNRDKRNVRKYRKLCLLLNRYLFVM